MSAAFSAIITVEALVLADGIAGITAANASGIQVVPVGESETKDETITRVRWYCGLANFSELGLAKANAIFGSAADA